MKQLFTAIADLQLGIVLEVSGTAVKVELGGDVAELSRSYGGRVYPIGQIGSVVKIHIGRRLVFGFVTLLRMRSEEQAEQGLPISPDADQRLMELELFAEGTWDSGKQELHFTRGISTYPLPRQGVFLLTRDEASMLYRAAEARRAGEEGGANALVPFAEYIGADSAECRVNIDAMFGTHCVVMGSTGSGKSAAVAALLHSVLEHKPKGDGPCKPRILIIDPHAEYGHAFNERARIYQAYDPIGAEAQAGERIKLPYWLMSADEFRSLVVGKTEQEATSQHNIVYKALTYARMAAAGLVDAVPEDYDVAWPDDGGELDEPRPKEGVQEDKLISFDRDKPRPFSLKDFVNHIVYMQAARKSSKTGTSERVPPGDFAKNFKSILDKLSVLKIDPRLKFLMEEWDPANSPTLASIIGQLVGADENRDIRIIDISGLPNEVAGPLSAMLARLLFQYKLYQTPEERKKDPVLFVCEEAHRYVPDRGEAQYAAAQSAVRRIAREGRKYGLGLMLVSQRPADLESTVIAQCGTWLVLRLTNSADQAHVARFLPDGLAGMTRVLPALAQREALFVGEGASLPARVRIRYLPPEKRPRSETISFADGWATDRLDDTEIGTIAERMTNGV